MNERIVGPVKISVGGIISDVPNSEASVKWSSAKTNIIDDIKAWQSAINQSVFNAPSRRLLSRDLILKINKLSDERFASAMYLLGIGMHGDVKAAKLNWNELTQNMLKKEEDENATN